MIEVGDLRKTYGETRALRGVSFTIRRGEIVGLLGPNGAGKTTAMKILTGYLLPTSGRASVADHDVLAEPLEVQRKIGYLPENAPLYTDMLVSEYLEFMARMRGVPTGGPRARGMKRVIDECGIGDVLGRTIGHLSKGYRQRVGLAASILHEPEILILDEPTTGLDPNQIVEVRDLIRRMGESKTVILSTHILPEVEATCGRAVILIDGLVRADGSLDELTRARTEVVTARVHDVSEAANDLATLPGVDAVRSEELGDGFTTFRLDLGDDAPIGERVSELCTSRGWPLRELRRDERTLEQVFRELTESRAEVAA
jgi:ABC-2 type transport system ATP-binding protein